MHNENPPHEDARPVHPFSELSPDCVLDALDSVGLRGDGRLLALNSYENRVYQVGIEDSAPLVAKFYRPARWSDAAILEEHAFVSELVEREIQVVPALEIAGSTLHQYQGFRFAVFPRHGGRAPELDDPATLEWIGRFIGRIHAVGALSDYKQRPALDHQTFGVEPREFLLEGNFLPPELLAAYSSVAQQALDGVKRGDQVRQMSDILAGYEDFCDFEPRQLYLVEALRTLRLIHYSAWLARRWDDPAFPVAFPWFNTQRYWQDRILELREQVALMDEAPLWPI